MNIRDVLFIIVAIIAVSALVMSSINTAQREKFDAPRLLAVGKDGVPTFAAYEFDGLESDSDFKTVTEGGTGKLNLDAHIASEITSRFPIGTIVLWANNAQPPAGWVNCDGGTHNGYLVPNLTNKFVRGATSIVDQENGYSGGGSYSVTLNPRNLPNHGHDVLGYAGGNTTNDDHELQGITTYDADSRLVGNDTWGTQGKCAVPAQKVGITSGLREYNPGPGVNDNGLPCNTTRDNATNLTNTNARGTDITNEQEAVEIPPPLYVELRYICYVGT